MSKSKIDRILDRVVPWIRVCLWTLAALSFTFPFIIAVCEGWTTVGGAIFAFIILSLFAILFLGMIFVALWAFGSGLISFWFEL